MKVTLIAKTNQKPTEFLSKVANRCYSTKSFEELKPKNKKELIKKIIQSGHLSVLEHISYTFSIEGVPVSLMGQLTRHRLASFCVQSLRYNNLKTKGAKYIDTKIYKELKNIVDNHFNLATKTYNNLIDNGFKPEEARYILPQGILTNIVMTMNVREIFHFLDLRNCNRADKPIQELAQKILKLCMKEDKLVFSFAKHSCLNCNNKCDKFKNKGVKNGHNNSK